MKLVRLKRIAAIVLCFALMISFMPNITFAKDSTDFIDMPDNWATESLNRAVSDGLLKGYDTYDGSEIRPAGNLTRAEFVTVVNRAFGAKNKATISGIADVKGNAWYADEIAKAINMKTMSMATTVRPNDSITRQEAFTILARAFSLKASDTNTINKFGDAGKVAIWATDSMNALVASGYVAGNGSNLNPTSNITRAEFAKIMDNMVGGYITEEGTVTSLGSGNIIVRASGVTIKDATITGDLILADGVDAGTINLEGVKVNGRVLVRSGNLNADDNSTLGTIQVLSAGSVIVSKTGTVEVAEGVTGVTLNGEAVGATPAETPTETPTTDVGSGGGGGFGPAPAPTPTIRDLTIDHEGTFSGAYNNVTITSAVGNGEVVLNNMTINGTLTVEGGGSNSIKLFATNPNRVVMNKNTSNGGEKPRLELTNSVIGQIEVLQAAIIEATNRASVIGTLKVKDEVTVNGKATKVDMVEVPSDAKNGVTVIVNEAVVTNVDNEKAGATVTGSAAKIEKIETTKPITIGGSNNITEVEIPVTAADSTEVNFQDTVKVENVDVKKENTTVNANQSAGGRVSNIEAKAAVTVGGSSADAVSKVTVQMAVNINIAGTGKTIEVAIDITAGNVNVITNGNTANFSASDGVNVGVGVNLTTQTSESAGPQGVTHICKWDAGEVTTNATCETDGARTFTCQSTEGTCPYANHRKTEIIPAIGHDFSGSGIETTPATCSAPGVRTYACVHDGCTATRTENIAMIPHTLRAHPAVAATCASEGNTAYWECSVCHKYFSDSQGANEINADSWGTERLSHNLTPHSGVTATCTTAGNSPYWECSACHKYFSDAQGRNEIEENSWGIPSRGHTIEHHEAMAVTLDTPGNSEYWSCSTCGKCFDDAACTHEITENSWIIAYKTEFALINTISRRIKDGDAFWYLKGIADGMSFESFTAASANEDAPCTVSDLNDPKCGLHKIIVNPDGIIERVIANPEVRAYISEKVVNRLDSTMRTIRATDGIIYDFTDDVVVYFYDEDDDEFIISDFAHIGRDKYFDAVATTTEAYNDGLYDIIIVYEEKPHAHNLTAHPAAAATCTENGNTAYWECTGCHKYFSDANGTTEIEADSWVISSTGHTSEAVARTNATTTTPARTAGHRCSVCGEVLDGCEEIALAPVANFTFDESTGEISFERPDDTYAGTIYCLSFYNSTTQRWTFPLQFRDGAFGRNGNLDQPKNVWARKLLALDDDVLAGTYTKARVETCLWTDEPDGYYQSIDEALSYRHIYGTVECDVNFTFSVAGDALEGTLMRAQIQDNLDDYLFYKLNSGTFEENKDYWFIHTQRYDMQGYRPETFAGRSFDCEGNDFDELELCKWEYFEEDAQGNYGWDEAWGITPDTRVYARSYVIDGNTITVTPLGSGATIPTERIGYDDSYAVQNLAIDNDGVITFTDPRHPRNSESEEYLILLKDQNQKYWQFWLSSETTNVREKIYWLWPQAGGSYEPPEGEFTFSELSVLTFANPRRAHRVYAKSTIDLTTLLQMTVDKSVDLYRINHDTDSDFVTLNLRNMPAELTDILAWALANPGNPNGNDDLEKAIVSIHCETMHNGQGRGFTHFSAADNDPIQINATDGTVTVVLSRFFGDDCGDTISDLEEASCWNITFTITDDSGNVTNYVTNVCGFGDDEDLADELCDNLRPLSGSTLAY